MDTYSDFLLYVMMVILATFESRSACLVVNRVKAGTAVIHALRGTSADKIMINASVIPTDVQGYMKTFAKNVLKIPGIHNPMVVALAVKSVNIIYAPLMVH